MARILVADDEVAVRFALVELLEAQGHDVLSVGQGQEALDQLPGDFDLLITDLAMPILDGGRLLDIVAARWPHLPVIIVTGAGAAGGRAGTVIAKPFGPEELTAAVAAALAAAPPLQPVPAG
ncbi:MAG TPA: response regulator [Alphaproteobacteria bacterium]|nr:response regulator [Alphaproteobacteria bacterium]